MVVHRIFASTSRMAAVNNLYTFAFAGASAKKATSNVGVSTNASAPVQQQAQQSVSQVYSSLLDKFGTMMKSQILGSGKVPPEEAGKVSMAIDKLIELLKKRGPTPQETAAIQSGNLEEFVRLFKADIQGIMAQAQAQMGASPMNFASQAQGPQTASQQQDASDPVMGYQNLLFSLVQKGLIPMEVAEAELANFSQLSQPEKQALLERLGRGDMNELKSRLQIAAQQVAANRGGGGGAPPVPQGDTQGGMPESAQNAPMKNSKWESFKAWVGDKYIRFMAYYSKVPKPIHWIIDAGLLILSFGLLQRTWQSGPMERVKNKVDKYNPFKKAEDKIDNPEMTVKEIESVMKQGSTEMNLIVDKIHDLWTDPELNLGKLSAYQILESAETGNLPSIIRRRKPLKPDSPQAIAIKRLYDLFAELGDKASGLCIAHLKKQKRIYQDVGETEAEACKADAKMFEADRRETLINAFSDAPHLLGAIVAQAKFDGINMSSPEDLITHLLDFSQGSIVKTLVRKMKEKGPIYTKLIRAISGSRRPSTQDEPTIALLNA